jgi:hypothetical protein
MGIETGSAACRQAGAIQHHFLLLHALYDRWLLLELLHVSAKKPAGGEGLLPLLFQKV